MPTISVDSFLDQLVLKQKTMIIMRGLPGSGKSSLAKAILEKSNKDVCIDANGRYRYASSDDYFMVSGSYKFDATQLSASHNYSFTQAMYGCQNFEDIVLVDNTNITRAEFTPYAMLGRAFSFKVILVHVEAPVGLCISRNRHGVPATTIERMAQNFENAFPWDPESYTVAAVV